MRRGEGWGCERLEQLRERCACRDYLLPLRQQARSPHATWRNPTCGGPVPLPSNGHADRRAAESIHRAARPAPGSSAAGWGRNCAERWVGQSALPWSKPLGCTDARRCPQVAPLLHKGTSNGPSPMERLCCTPRLAEVWPDGGGRGGGAARQRQGPLPHQVRVMGGRACSR